MNCNVILKDFFSKNLTIGCIAAASMFAGCANVEGVNEVKGGEKIGEGKFAANPIVVPIHGFTGVYENLKPLCSKIEKELYGSTSHITILIPEDRGNLSSTGSIEKQAEFVYSDIEKALLRIHESYGKDYNGRIPVNLVTISQGTQVALELLHLLYEKGFDKMFDFKIFGVNSVFHGCSLVDNTLNNPFIKMFAGQIIDDMIVKKPGLYELRKEACEARLNKLSKILNPITCHLVGSITNNPTEFLNTFGMGGFAPFANTLLDKENDGLLSISNQLGLQQEIVKITTSYIKGNYNHVSLHCWNEEKDTPYLEEVFEKYLEFGGVLKS